MSTVASTPSLAPAARTTLRMAWATRPRWLGTLAQPLDGLVVVDVDFGGLGPGRVEPDALDETPVAGRPGIRSHDAIGRLLLLAHALEAELDGHLSPNPGPDRPCRAS